MQAGVTLTEVTEGEEVTEAAEVTLGKIHDRVLVSFKDTTLLLS